MLLAYVLLFPETTSMHTFAILAVGIAAIAGHCRPVFYGFRGGGGIATSIGVYIFFIPLELFVSMFLGFFIVMVFIKKVRFRIGRWTPMMFVIIIPLLTLVFNSVVGIPLIGHMSIGGHPWYVLVGIFIITLFLIGMNWKTLSDTLKERRESS